MKSFLSRFGSMILFVLSGFDRLRLCGESRLLNHARGVQSYCYQRRVLFKDFPAHAQSLTDIFRNDTLAQLGNVPRKHLDSPDIDKEAIALQLASQHGISSGRIALITCLESALTYRLRGNQAGLVEIRKEKTRCLHHYHYFLHEHFGLCYVRIQTWFPFSVRIGLNGRRWLARQLESQGVPFQRRGNLITAVDDPQLAQQLLDEQPRIDWPAHLRELVRPVHPLWDYLHDTTNTPFYWMTEQSEWASDYVFAQADDLARLYPRFLRHGIETLQCKDVLRYLGKKVPRNGYGGCSGEAKIDLRTRADGARLKFWYDTNSIKIYDKEALALRIETTINQPKGFQVFRRKEGDPADAAPSWQQMRKGVADLSRRAEVSQSANNQLAESLATVEEPTTLGKLLEPLGRPVCQKGRRLARPLNPLTGNDGKVLRALADGSYHINGFRNRDLRVALHGVCADADERRRQAAAITRLLAILRAHDLIVKVSNTHRYRLSAAGKRVTTALLSAHTATIANLAA